MIRSKQKLQIEIRPAFIAFLCAYYYFDPANSFFPFLFSASAHEAGHLIALLAMHIPVKRFSLTACGAVLETPMLPYWQELIAAAAGPAVNLLLFAVLMRKMPLFSLINFFLFSYNLLPFYPLDGGRILRAVLSMLLPQKSARILEKCITVFGMAALTGFCIYLTCVWHAGLWPVILCAIIIIKISYSGVKNELFCV